MSESGDSRINKKGVSTIIATAMLILITLVAIFLLWFFLRPTIVGTDEKLGTAADCIRVRVEPVSCQYYINNNSEICPVGTLLAANVRRAAGTGNYNGFNLIFKKSDGTQLILNNSAFGITPRGLKPLDETQYKVYGKFLNITQLPFGTTFTNMNVAVLVGKDRKSCNPLNAEVKCVETKNVKVDACTDYYTDGEFNIFDFQEFVNIWNRAVDEWNERIKSSGCNNLEDKDKKDECINNAIDEALKNNTGADFNGNGAFDVDDFASFCATIESQKKDGAC